MGKKENKNISLNIIPLVFENIPKTKESKMIARKKFLRNIFDTGYFSLRIFLTSDIFSPWIIFDGMFFVGIFSKRSLKLLYSWRHFPELDRIIRLPPEPEKAPPPYQISGSFPSAPIYQLSPHQEVPSAPNVVQGKVIHPPAYQQVHQNHTQQGYNPNFNVI